MNLINNLVFNIWLGIFFGVKVVEVFFRRFWCGIESKICK